MNVDQQTAALALGVTLDTLTGLKPRRYRSAHTIVALADNPPPWLRRAWARHPDPDPEASSAALERVRAMTV